MPRHRKKEGNSKERNSSIILIQDYVRVYFKQYSLFIYFILTIATFCILLQATALSYHARTPGHVIGSSESVNIKFFGIPYTLPYCIRIERSDVYSLQGSYSQDSSKTLFKIRIFLKKHFIPLKFNIFKELSTYAFFALFYYYPSPPPSEVTFKTLYINILTLGFVIRELQNKKCDHPQPPQ